MIKQELYKKQIKDILYIQKTQWCDYGKLNIMYWSHEGRISWNVYNMDIHDKL